MRVIHYLFKKKNKTMTDETIGLFFDNGVSFPQFVALIFNIDQIPNLNQNPKTIFHKKINNDLALQFLFQNNQKIAKFCPKYDSLRDQYNLLSLILTNQCFNLDYQSIVDKCNRIVQPLGIFYNTKKDLANYKCILNLLYVLTDIKIPNENDICDLELLNQISAKANVPFIIDKTSLEMQNQFLFFIQIEIIFDFFKNKINQENLPSELINTSQNNQLTATNTIFESQFKNIKGGEQPKEEEESSKDEQPKEEVESNKDEQPKEEEESNKDKQPKEEQEKGTDLASNVEQQKDSEQPKGGSDSKSQKKKKSKLKFNSFNVHSQNISEEALLKTLNLIGATYNLHFKNFEESIENDNLPKFVKHMLKNQSSKQIIDDIINDKNTSNLAKISLVVDYLRTISSRFEILSFDFKSVDFAKPSAILFYKNLLDSFFLEKTYDELYDRCYTILYGKINSKDKNFKRYDQKKDILYNNNTYISLINYIYTKNIVLDEKILSSLKDSICKNQDLPLIFHYNFSQIRRSYENYPYLVYYQLQLIFNILDSSPNHIMKEYFLIALRKFNQVKLPSCEQILKSVRAKNISLILQIRRSKEKIDKKKKIIKT